MKTTKKRTTKPQFSASVRILGKTYVAKSSDLRKAIESLDVGKVAKGVSILEVSHGDSKKSVILPPAQTFRVFSSSGMVREIAMKNLLLRFSGI